jgi:hypothetical protein
MNEVKGCAGQKNKKPGTGGVIYERLERYDDIHAGEMSNG